MPTDVINTGTTIVTFLIQQNQNKDSVALYLKLNELIASHRAASTGMIGIEDASEDELRRMAAAYPRMSNGGSDSNGREATGSAQPRKGDPEGANAPR